jgi:hypothetical protein
VLPVKITRARAEQLLAAFNSGEPLAPSGETDGWNGNDMLMLAGFCMFGAMSQGPDGWSVEAERFMENLEAAMRCYANLAMQVADGEFEALYGDRLIAAVKDRDGRIAMEILERGKSN